MPRKHRDLEEIAFDMAKSLGIYVDSYAGSPYKANAEPILKEYQRFLSHWHGLRTQTIDSWGKLEGKIVSILSDEDSDLSEIAEKAKEIVETVKCLEQIDSSFKNNLFPLTTTLGRIKSLLPDIDNFREREGCKSIPDWSKIRYLRDSLNSPIRFSEIAEKLGTETALECCPAEPEYEIAWRKFSVWCARRVQHLFILATSKSALDIADQCISGERSWVAMEDARIAAKVAAKGAGSNDIADWVAVRALENFYPYGAAGALSENCGWGVPKIALMVIRKELGEAKEEEEKWAQTEAFIQLTTLGTLPDLP